MTNKEKYLRDRGYSLDLINFVKECGAQKHMVWLVEKLAKIDFKRGTKEKEAITVLSNHLEKLNANKYKSFEEALRTAIIERKKEKMLKENILHKFNNGYYIVNVPADCLMAEAKDMSNCINDYKEQIKARTCAILALKNKRDKTLVHFQIKKNGALDQLYEKANKDVRLEYWNYIAKFFDQK